MTDAGPRRAPARPHGETAVGIEALTEEILPALIVRLRASKLAELEVRSEGWRVRLRRDMNATRRQRPPGPCVGDDALPDEQVAGVARSPAVGYFSPAELLAVGRTVQPGDTLGSVDVLGISQDVTAPAGGIISAVLAEAGQAVEYGQVLARIDVMAGVLEDVVPDVAAEASAADAAAAP